MPPLSPLARLTGLVAVALLYAFINGYNDSAIILAGELVSRAITRRRARLLGALAAFTGPQFFGVAIATTVGHGLVDASAIAPDVLLAASLIVVGWVLVSNLLRIPASSTHALLGSLVGAAIVDAGPRAVVLPGLLRVVLFLFVAPLAGLLLSALLMRLTLFLARGSGPGINRLFRQASVLSTLALGMGHSANDAQKSMGMIALALSLLGFQTTFHVPLWVILSAAGAFSLGILAGAGRSMRTLASMYRIRPVNSFVATLSGAVVMIAGAELGAPLSTGQSVSMSIAGAGAAERMNKVRWHIVNRLLLAWVITLPGAATLSGLLLLLVRQLGLA